MKEFKIDQYPKIGTGFQVPEGYFETLEQKVMQRISNHERPVINLFSSKKWWFVAASIIVLLTIGISLLNRSNTMEQIDDAQLEQYIANQSDLTEDDLVEILDEEKIQKIHVDINGNEQEIEEIILNSTNIEHELIN